jgi:purine-cytosine permease-like protein
MSKLDGFGVETRGIERVLPDERTHTSVADCMWLWMAANCTTSTFALGILGASFFQLTFRPAVLTIIFFNLFSTVPVAYFATFGPKLGLRQLTLSRFSFSLYFPSCISIVLNIIGCVGSATVDTISGVLVLRAASDAGQPDVPTVAAIVIIGVLTLIPSFIGYRHVHTYERYSWIPIAIVFLIVLGLSAKYMDLQPWPSTPTNVTVSAVLGFVSVGILRR